MKVAIDGPAGAGKSSVAKALSQKRGFLFLDTGATYRCVALAALRSGTSLQDEHALTDLASSLAISFEAGENQRQHVLLNGIDVTDDIRTPQVDAAVSIVARLESIRTLMVTLQRSIAQGHDVVAEGRDIATVVFPDAEVKVFLTADARARAHRRALQNTDRFEGDVKQVSEEFILQAINERDRQDSSRTVAPLMPAQGAIHIDSSNMTLEDVIATVERLVDDAQNV